MKGWKRICTGLVLVIVMAVSSACVGGEEEERYDASGYVKAVLDASFKGKIDNYTAMTGAKSADAKSMYEQNVSTLVDEWEQAVDMEMSTDMRTKYTELMKKMMQLAKYQMGTTSMDADGNYSVRVKVDSCLVMDGVMESLNDQVKSYSEEHDMNGMSKEELSDATYGILYDILQNQVENPTYGEEQTVSVYVKKSKKGIYQIPQKDLSAVATLIFNSEE